MPEFTFDASLTVEAESKEAAAEEAEAVENLTNMLDRIEANDYMKKPNDPPFKPCGKCGAEINANWTIRDLQERIEALEAERCAVDKVLEAWEATMNRFLEQGNNISAENMELRITDILVARKAAPEKTE